MSHINNIKGCKIIVPTVLHQDSNSLDKASQPYITLSFRIGDRTENDMFKYDLTLAETQQISMWLTEASINLVDNSEEQQKKQAGELIILPIEDLAKTRTNLISQLNYKTKEDIENSIMVDIATASNNYQFIRLIFVDEIIMAYCLYKAMSKQVCDGLANALEYLKQHHLHGGISFLLIEFATRQAFFILKFEDLEKWWNEAKNGGRKSIPFAWFAEHCQRCRMSRGIPFDYLAAVGL